MSKTTKAHSPKTGEFKQRIVHSLPSTERQLTVYEKKFLLCAERGDVSAVRDLLETHGNNSRFDINCVDPLGRSALVVAIENENLNLIELLLKHGIKTKDSLLHAINEEFVEAVETLLQYEERLHKTGQAYSWELVDRETATFTPDITPLILAARQDNYEILKVLLDRGATLPMPHDIRCGCNECLVSIEEDCLKHSQSRINAYRALTSPSLISLSSRDPILTAFELSSELRRLCSTEKEFKIQYTELRDKCQEFVTSLLDHIRTSYELEIILNYDPDGLNQDYEDCNTTKLERLKLAIFYKQKTFVAHPNVQQLLASLWYKGMPGFRRKGISGKFLLLCKLGLLLPLYSLAYIVSPKSKMGRTMKYPFAKFIFHSASYLFFLFLLILASQRVETLVIEMFGTKAMREWVKLQHQQERGQLPGYVESGIMIYVVGFIWWEIKQLWDAGIDDYVKDMWNILDFITNALYFTWIALRMLAWYLVRQELSAGIDAYQPREKWHPYDPMLISEGMFGAANIFSFLKLVHIFSVNPYLGPLQISLGRMVYDIIKFFFIYSLVLFAFGCGMNHLLWYYAELDKNKCYNTSVPHNEDSRSCEVWRRFANLFETSQSLFWASFGLVDIHNFDLTGIQEYTRFWGLLMFGSYCVINVVVLLNLLIAMMSNSYQIISERSDVEWKFARSKLWMDYFEEGGTVPPPFNIIPSIKSLQRLFGCSKKRRSVSVKVKEGRSRVAQYESVIKCLVRRYITAQQKKAEVRNVTEDDVSEVKQLVTSFRSELFDILRDNGMKCTHVSCEREGGRKEKVRERRLLKDFNIGMVERVFENMFKQRSAYAKPFDIVRQMTNKQSKMKRNWNAIVAASLSKQNQIGSSRPSINDSISDLREMILKEQDPKLHRKMVLKKFANIARRARLMQNKNTLEVVEETEEDSYNSEKESLEQVEISPCSSDGQLLASSSVKVLNESLSEIESAFSGIRENLTESLKCLLPQKDDKPEEDYTSSEISFIGNPNESKVAPSSPETTSLVTSHSRAPSTSKSNDVSKSNVGRITTSLETTFSSGADFPKVELSKQNGPGSENLRLSHCGTGSNKITDQYRDQPKSGWL